MKYLLFLSFFALLIPVGFANAESMNLGKIYWDDEVVSSNSFAKIIVEDNNMNKKEYPNFADKFSIVVWSDSTEEKIEVGLVHGYA